MKPRVKVRKRTIKQKIMDVYRRQSRGGKSALPRDRRDGEGGLPVPAVPPKGPLPLSGGAAAGLDVEGG